MNPLALYNFPVQHRAILLALIVWTMVWKGMALWKAGRKDDMVWFIILLVVNTVGILDIIYIYHLADRKRKTSHEA